MGSCRQVMLHLGQMPDPLCRALIQQSQAVPVAPQSPKNAQEKEAPALGVEKAVPPAGSRSVPGRSGCLAGAALKVGLTCRLPAKPRPAEN